MSRRLILFAPGAGAPSSHPWMQTWKQRLSKIGEVETFDYDYMRAGRKRADPLPQLIAAHRKALEGREKTSAGFDLPDREKHGRPYRMPCVARGESGRPGLSWLSALRHGRSHKTSRRSFAALTMPILFVQGTRDALCPLDLLERVRTEMKTGNFLHVVESGDHSLRVPKRQLQAIGETQEEVDQRAFGAVAGFIDQFAATAD